MPGGGNSGFVSSAKTSRSGSLNGRDLSITPLTTLNSAVFAPRPNAIVITATAVTPGFLSSIRKPNRTSRKTASISSSDESLSSLFKRLLSVKEFLNEIEILLIQHGHRTLGISLAVYPATDDDSLWTCVRARDKSARDRNFRAAVLDARDLEFGWHKTSAADYARTDSPSRNRICTRGYYILPNDLSDTLYHLNSFHLLHRLMGLPSSNVDSLQELV